VLEKQVHTLRQWEKEYSRHPEWHSLNPSELNKPNGTGSLAFYQAFTRWLRKNVEESQRERYARQLFKDYRR
jgi:hypothetical protein